MTEQQNNETEPFFDSALYASWSTEELHSLAHELQIPNYQQISRETLIELMIRRLF